MSTPVVFMFSGQGSQYYHMGRELYDRHPRFRLWMDYCDELTQPLIGRSLLEVIYDDDASKAQPFDRIVYSNPALLCIEYSLARILMEMGLQPDYLLGYSLGEMAASVVAGAVPLEQGIEWGVEYARVLEEQTPPAAMLGIIDSARIMDRHTELFRGCWLTGSNFDNSFVVSGLAADIDRLQTGLRERNIACQRLAVNYGFHTCLMDPVREPFRRLAQKINYTAPGIPLISSLKARRISEVSETHFWEVTRHPVAFRETIAHLLANRDYIFIDVGPSGTLATFIKYLLPADSESMPLETINQFGRDVQSIEKLRTDLRL